LYAFDHLGKPYSDTGNAYHDKTEIRLWRKEMKILLAIMVIIFTYAGAVFADDPAEGFWLSVDQKTGKVESGWEIYEDNGVLMGRLLSGLGLSATSRATKCKESYPNFPIGGKVNQLPVLGTPWIFGLSQQSPGRWTNGNVIDPSNGSIYKCSIFYHQADGNKFMQEALEIRGQFLFFSGSQYWRRATREEASAL
jgi:uncharacterized protein (DUF2147 family)